MTEKMVERRGWQEFRESGLLWWVNRMLHLFGWALVVELDDVGEVSSVYPGHCRFRGFDHKSEDQGFARLTKHLQQSMERIAKDAPDDPEEIDHE